MLVTWWFNAAKLRSPEPTAAREIEQEEDLDDDENAQGTVIGKIYTKLRIFVTSMVLKGDRMKPIDGLVLDQPLPTMPGKDWPGVALAGVKKGGTSAVAEMLNMHPVIAK